MSNGLDEMERDLKVIVILCAMAGVSSLVGLVLTIWMMYN